MALVPLELPAKSGRKSVPWACTGAASSEETLLAMSSSRNRWQYPGAEPQIVRLSQVTLTERPTPAARALQETLDTFHATSDASTSYSDATQQAYESVGLLRQLKMRQRRYANKPNAGRPQ